MDLSSWADRNRAHRDAERLEQSAAVSRRSGSKATAGPAKGLAGPPIELEPLSKPIGARGRETGRADLPRSMSMSPSARVSDASSKRAQYDQANQEYLSLLKKEKQRRQAKWDDGPVASSAAAKRPLPALPDLKDSAHSADNSPVSGRAAAGDAAAEPHVSARTPPPASTRITSRSARAAAQVSPSTGAMSANFDPSSLEDNENGYLSADEESAQAKRAKANGRMRVIVRKRPLNEREGGEDCVNCSGRRIHVEATKLRVDLTEYKESHHYEFDDACAETESNRDVYEKCGRQLITTVFEGGSASCFAYGQTGSGKTYTMLGSEQEPGVYVLAAEDIFARCQPNHRVFVSLYEIYCNSLFDLLNQRQALQPREDANRRINICGLTWHEIRSVKDLLRVIDRGTLQRRTGSTSANEFSSRSHAVMTISLRDEEQPKFMGSLNVVDLAGSERAADTAANDKQTRLEGAEINKSLLALKECIRGLDEGKRHIQFRGSKLTEVLRDSFVGNSRTVMIATVSPSTTNAEHTLNTLRYSFRVKGLSIDCPMPSKERNAPRPTQRSKSTDAELATRRAEKEKEKQEKEAKRKKSHKKRTPRRAAVGRSADAAVEPEVLDKLVEARLSQAVVQMRSQFEEQERKHLEEQQRQAAEQRKQADLITALSDQVKMLNQQLQTNARPPRLPPLSDAAAAGGGSGSQDVADISPSADSSAQRPRSERASRRSRRRHHQQPSANSSPTKADPGSAARTSFNSSSGGAATSRPTTVDRSGASAAAPTKASPAGAPIEEVVTLDELAL